MDETRYQVFVSSTFKDLADEREKVLQAILQLRAFPAGMELFPAADEEQFEFIKREIDSSDYYIVLIGGKYGSLDAAGMSFTEKEYDYALSISKPILAFLVKDLNRLSGDKLETSDSAREKLEAFRAKASKARLIRHYSNPDELKSEVLHSLPLQFNQRPMRGWVRAGQQTVENLEELAGLHREVLTLRSKIEVLEAAQERPEFLLADGSAAVEWNLNFNQFAFNNNWPVQREYRFRSSWDKLLVGIFSFGSSQATEDQVKRRLARLILDSCPSEIGGAEWRSSAEDAILKWEAFPALPPVDLVFGDVLVQFNGLGLLQETRTTDYKVDPYNQSNRIPQMVAVWSLTPKGQQKLALARGHLR